MYDLIRYSSLYSHAYSIDDGQSEATKLIYHIQHNAISKLRRYLGNKLLSG